MSTLTELKNALLEAPEHHRSDIDASLKDDIRKWSDPPTSDEIKAVLDKAAYGALASDFGMKILMLVYNKALEAEGKPVEPLPEKPKHKALFVATKLYVEPEGGWVNHLKVQPDASAAVSEIYGQFMGRPDLAIFMDKEFHENPEFRTVDIKVQCAVALCGSHFKSSFNTDSRVKYVRALADEVESRDEGTARWLRRLIG